MLKKTQIKHKLKKAVLISTALFIVPQGYVVVTEQLGSQGFM